LPPLQPVSRTVQVPIPMFHHISNVPVYEALARSLEVNPTLFTQQMDYLKAQGYHTITFNQLFNALYYGGPLPTKPIILTFDDGYDDAYKFAYPILKAHGFSGMFYIITGKIGWGGQMTWRQMSEMLQNGMQMGSHTIHHVDMGQVLNESLVQAQQELQVSQITLQRGFGIPIQQFCYPSGEPFRHGTLAEQQQIVSLLAQDGYVGATTDPGMTGTMQDDMAPFELLRIRVDGRSSLQTFEQSMPW
ncbi:MAG: polysaccharide deacetylase family protein, partial [Ktedonobacteraceae bacterium]|nr:polysaccharide deacetylase family protein [Ktedonobacteraceae bacterium]